MNRNSLPAKKRLVQLDFDPIERLINLYNEISEEINYQINLRNGRIKPIEYLDAEDGIKKRNPPRYSAVAHAALLSQKEKVANDLLRYGYGRVPETLNLLEERSSPLVINLTKEGETYIINESTNESLEYIEDNELVDFK